VPLAPEGEAHRARSFHIQFGFGGQRMLRW
jgi:hypothetical protein